MREVVRRVLPAMPKPFALTMVAFGVVLERLLSRGSVDVEADARKMLVELEDEELRRAIVHYVTTTAFGRTVMVFMSGQYRGCQADTWTSTVKEATILWSAAEEEDLPALRALTKALAADLDALPASDIERLREAAATTLKGNPWPSSEPRRRGRPHEAEFPGYMRELAAERLAPDQVVAGKRRNRREAAYTSRIAAKRVDGRWSGRTIEKYIGAVVKEVPIPKGANNTLVVSRFAPLFDDPLDDRATRELGTLTAKRRAARSRP